MISYRQADLLNTFKEQNAPIVNVECTINFPTTNHGQEFLKNDNGMYVADFWLNIDEIAPNSEGVVDRISRVLNMPGLGEVNNTSLDDVMILSKENETWDDFNRRLKREFVEKLQPICVEPIDVEPQTSGRYAWVLHMKIRNFS